VLYLSGVRAEGLPLMNTPDVSYRPTGGVWAADSGCWSNAKAYSDERYLRWLDRQPREGCLFATAPDVVGDAAATLERATPMLPRIRELGFPVALVAQPTLMAADVPWHAIDALFIGGPDWWHSSDHVHELVREAKHRGKWVHEGRVNSWKRYDRARAIGYDSVDGTYLRFDPKLKRSPGPRGWMDRAALEPHIWKAR
jgi:hypothetical protein